MLLFAERENIIHLGELQNGQRWELGKCKKKLIMCYFSIATDSISEG